MDTSKWVGFFTKAGLPPNVAANYALIFSENRIQVGMLLDLSKEYLYDMGIRVMGDVIAILKYAKEYHNQLEQYRLIKRPESSKPSIAERLVGHYTKPATSPSFLSQSIHSQPIRSQPVRSQPIRSHPIQSQPIQSQPIRSQPIRSQPIQKNFPAKPKLISLRPNTQQNIPKKIRRVPPEEEGAYRIKMPLGTTDKTRKILQNQARQAAAAKRSVFTRLGESAVSSSTDFSKTSSSVFERLGGNKMNRDDMPTSTVVTDMDRPKKIALPLQYKGILKKNISLNRVVVTASNKTMTRTVMHPSQRLAQTATKASRINQINALLQQNELPKKRLLLTKARVTTSQNLFADKFAVKKINVKNRLGRQNDARNIVKLKLATKGHRPSSVFNRIGR